MRCRSIACIWTESPPPHKVTAAAALSRPPTLYTAGSDGSIVWWNVSPTQEIQSVAMLCGHAAPVADLAICCPTADSGDGERDHTSKISVSNTADHGDLFSVCIDGEMCVWSRASGNCRRRRKMPPWVGSPLMVRVLPDNPRYVCIASCFTGGENSFDNPSLDSSDVGSSKCTVVIVDTYSLTIVQTVFHGNLSIGPLRFMALVPAMEDMEKQFILLFDSYGKLQSVPILREPSDEANGNYVQNYVYNMDLKEQVEGLSEQLQAVTITTSGKILAFVYRTFCIFRFVKDGTALGEISFADNQLYSKDGFINSHGVCGIFLECDDRNVLKTQESCDSIIENFVVWNIDGLAVVYRITYIDCIFNFELSSVIPAPNHSPAVRSSFSFIQLSSCLLRISSTCSHLEDPCLWKPHITSWSLPQQQDNNTNLSQECQMLGEGGFLDDNSRTSFVGHNEDCINLNSIKYGFAQEGRFVSSTMIISEPSSHIPYAVVYGFHSGEIEVVHLNIHVENVDSCSISSKKEPGSTISKQLFIGHTRSVVCLAAHRMVGFAKGWSFRLVLISGSLDCTIRLWDLESSNIITIMHHHVAPVRQIILPSPQTDRPWNDCFLSVGEDNCVTLVSLQTLRAERMFPGHLSYPEKVVWDGKKGYLACLCQSYPKLFDALDVLYIWDIKAGTRERVLRGTASQSMFEHFCKGTNSNTAFGAGNTSASSFFHALVEDTKPSELQMNKSGKDASSSNVTNTDLSKGNPPKNFSSTQKVFQNNRHAISGYSPFPGIAALSFDLALLMSPSQKHDLSKQASNKKEKDHMRKDENGKKSPQHVMADGSPHNTSDLDVISIDTASEDARVQSLELCLLHFGLSFLHSWDVDSELDKLLITEMKLKRPEIFLLASGLQGDRGSLTLTFPNSRGTLELWKLSSEFTAMRALTMVSLAQRMISLSHSSSSASSALSAFYTRNFLEKIPDVKPPLLQLLVSFWQDESEYVRMAARTLFHCAASRAIPLPLCTQKANIYGLASSPDGMEASGNKIPETELTSRNSLNSVNSLVKEVLSETEESEILSWLESFEMQDWISCIGGTSQDAMTSHIIVAAALTIWYPSLVKPSLAMLVVHPLIKLVMAMNGKYSSTAAELLAEGMESMWKACIASEIPRLIGDIFFQIECVSGPPASSSTQHPPVPISFQKTLVGTLLPSLTIADVLGFLQVIESQIWSTASDSPVHVISLMTLIRIVRGSPRNLAPHLDKVVNFILHTMDPSNLVMRRTCLQSSMTALKEVVRVFPMVALNETSTRLAIGDAIGEVNNASIRVYDMQSMTKIKVLDASGPLGLPNLLGGFSEVDTMTSTSALSFSPEGEGLVAFSENGLMIRWWSLGSAWWEKISRNLVPVQCTKLIFVPPWEGFSPNSTRSSIMASAMGFDRQGSSKENTGVSSDADRLKLLILNLDLSYRLSWVGERKVLLTRNDHDLGTFQV